MPANKQLWLAGAFALLLAIAVSPAIAVESPFEAPGFYSYSGTPGEACGQTPAAGFAALQAGGERAKSGSRAAALGVPAESIGFDRPTGKSSVVARQVPTPVTALFRVHSGRAPPSTTSL
jgi:hypothetical protein